MSKYIFQRKRYEYSNQNDDKKEPIYFNPSRLSPDLIKKYTLTCFNNDAINVALLVESRIFYNTEFILRQFSRYLPVDFTMYIYVTENVYNNYFEIIQRLNNNINLRLLSNEFKLSSNVDYNNLMLNINFWNLFIEFERVLIFQSTSMIFHSGIEQFYKYDFIGAPFSPEYKISTNIGNGGMSLRNIKAIIYCLKNKNKVRILRYKTYLENIKKYNNNHAEYIFYVYAMNQFKYNVANIETASLFAIKDFMYNNECMFSGKLYKFNEELYTKLLLKSIELTFEDVILSSDEPINKSDVLISLVDIMVTESLLNTGTIITVNQTNYKQRNFEYYKMILLKNNNILLTNKTNRYDNNKSDENNTYDENNKDNETNTYDETNIYDKTNINDEANKIKSMDKPNYKQIMYTLSKLVGGDTIFNQIKKNKYNQNNFLFQEKTKLNTHNLIESTTDFSSNTQLIALNQLDSINQTDNYIKRRYLPRNIYIPKNKKSLIEDIKSKDISIDSTNNVNIIRSVLNKQLPSKRYIPREKLSLIEDIKSKDISIDSTNNVDTIRSIPNKQLPSKRYIPKEKLSLIEDIKLKDISIDSTNNVNTIRSVPNKHLPSKRYISKEKRVFIKDTPLEVPINIPMKYLAPKRYIPKENPIFIEDTPLEVPINIPMKYLAPKRYIPKENPVLIEDISLDIPRNVVMKYLAPKTNKSNIKSLLIENNKPEYITNYKFLDPKLIERYSLSQFNNNSKNVALMLESRLFENTEFIFRQFSRYLPEDFAIWIYVTSNVYNSYVELANKLNNNINIVLLPQQYILNSVNDYNNIMLDISFWTLLQQFERVLVFQMDTMIYHKGIELYYEYDYIGAPWNPSSNIATSVGNGGLSLRNIQAMIYCLQNRNSVQVGSFNKNNIAEDIFYAYAMNQFGYKVANVETALSFSIESYGYTENSLGSHKLYEYNSELYDKLILRSIYNNNSVESNIYIIGGVAGGGSLKFINEFKQHFPDAMQIKSNNIFQLLSFSTNDILFIQHLVEDITPSIISSIKQKYQCRIIISIHDFYYMRDVNNPENGYLLDNIQISENILNLFKDAELVIHPSKFTFTHYSRYISNDNFIISPHIDFKILESELNIPTIVDNTINIGVMHAFSEYKGKELINYLMNEIIDYKGYKVEFKIVGRNIPEYNENEFFELLNKYNIHCLTVLNKWGETYCYSLSKFLKSGLPIIYNNIGAVGERMPNKEYYFKVFDNEFKININNPILKNKFLEMLDYIILNQSILQKNKIDLTVEVPKLYDNIFNMNKYNKINNNSVKNIILLSSAIMTSNNPLSYTHIRSSFGYEERFRQTIKNINILRYKIPDCALILIDATNLLKDYKLYLDKTIDQFIDLSTNLEQISYANESLNKGIAECAQLLEGLKFIGQYTNAINIFKITGRYFLSKSFKYDNFINEKVSFKIVPESSTFYELVPACYTFFYKVPIKYKNEFKKALENTIIKCIEIKEHVSIETILPFEFDKDIIVYNSILGVSGFVGPSKYYLDDIT